MKAMRVSARQERIELLAVASGSHGHDRPLVPQPSRDGGQGVQMVAVSAGRQEQQKNEVYALAIDGIEVQRRLEARKKPDRF